MNNSEYVRKSLELHLFFDRIMKEHSFFISAAFLDRDKNLREVANNFQNVFSDILNDIINLANGRVSSEFLDNKEIVTNNTLDAEAKTNSLTDADIDINITKMELDLESGNIEETQELLNAISNINRQTLPIVENLIQFKNDILNEVFDCKMYTTNYPLLISHIMNEAKMYHTLLSKIESRKTITKNELYEHELFWNNIMKEHALFIRGLLDPSEEDLILTANRYVEEYKDIIKNYDNNPTHLTDISLNETIKFRDFKIAGEEGILNCEVKSIIIPLLADHVVREANHFIRILESIK